MSELEVTYFDFAGGRGEEVRLALTMAGITFDDNRINGETFGKLKPELPFGSLPILGIEGLGVFSQSNAILRLIGRKHGLHPEDAIKAARHDAIMDAVEDLRHRITPTMHMEDAAEKKAARQQLASDYVPHWGRCIERQLGDGPFVDGEKPNVADIKLYMVDKWISSGGVDDIPRSVFDPYPKLKALTEGIRNHPAVVGWYARAG